MERVLRDGRDWHEVVKIKREGETTMAKKEEEEKPGYQTFEEICKWMTIAQTEGDLFYAKGNKSAGRRARMALDQVAKLKVQWRKEMIGPAEGQVE